MKTTMDAKDITDRLNEMDPYVLADDFMDHWYAGPELHFCTLHLDPYSGKAMYSQIKRIESPLYPLLIYPRKFMGEFLNVYNVLCAHLHEASIYLENHQIEKEIAGALEERKQYVRLMGHLEGVKTT